MFRTLVTALLLTTLSCVAFPQPLLTTAEPDSLATLLGIDSIITSTKSQVEESNRRQMASLFGQIEKAYPKLTKAQLEFLRTEGEKLFLTPLNAWSAEDIKQIYVAELSQRMSPEDISKAMQFYSTRSGQTIYLSVRIAEQKAVAHMISSQEKAMNEAVAAFMASVKTTLAKPPK